MFPFNYQSINKFYFTNECKETGTCHSSNIDILKDKDTSDYSYTYNIHTHLSINGDWWSVPLLKISVTILLLLFISCYSAHQAVNTHIRQTTFAHRKWPTGAGVSWDINNSFECVTITDSKFSNRVLVWMTTKSTTINCVGAIWLEHFECLPPLVQMRHITNFILPAELFFNIFIISASCMS